MSDERLGDVLVALVFCTIAAFASNELIRLAATFAAGWHTSWAIQGDAR